MKRLSLIAIVGLLAFFFVSFQQGKENQQAIQAKAEAYSKAYNNRDYKALMSLWAEDAVYVNPESGEVLEGRAEIEESIRDNLSDKPNLKLTFKVESVSFPKEGQALEVGTATITNGSDDVTKAAYKALYIKQGNDWLIKEVREVDIGEAPTQYDNLKELSWLIGEWIDQDEDSEILTKTGWDKYKNFITQSFRVKVEGQIVLEGRQIITWDAAEEEIRSWIFDSDGTFGEGTWTKKGDKWIVETLQTLADGSRASAINIYTPKGSDSYTWESTGREVGGEILPDIDPVTIVRKKG